MLTWLDDVLAAGYWASLHWTHRRWYHLRARQMARAAAWRHLATVTKALYRGSTEAYTLIADLPRVADSTHVAW